MIKQCGDDPNVGALLITGAGTAFCAGGDVKGMGSNSNKKEVAFEERVADLPDQAAHLDRCAGGAEEADDRRRFRDPRPAPGWRLRSPAISALPARSAIMSTGYARIGLTGDYGIAWLLTRLVGTSRARELMFLSERIDARRCETLGLVNRVVPDAAIARDGLCAREGRLAEGPSIALAHIKDNLDHALRSDFWI